MVRFQFLLPALAVSMTSLGIAAIFAKPEDVSSANDPTTTSAAASSERSANNPSSDSLLDGTKKPQACNRDKIRADIIQALQTPLGYDESRMKLQLSDVPADVIDVDCNNEKLNTVEILADKLKLSASGSFTGLCSKYGSKYGGSHYEDVRDVAFSFTAKLWLKFRVEAGDLTLETDDKTAIISTQTSTLKGEHQQQCVDYEGQPPRKHFQMIPNLQGELAYAYSQLIDDAIRETWVTPCQGIDRQKIFKEYADDILKKEESVAFAHEYGGVTACYATDKNARGDPFTASFIDKPSTENMVLSCASHGKIEHIGFKKVKLQVSGSAKADVSFWSSKKLNFDVTVTADLNFNANKAYPAKSSVRMIRNVAILKFELNQPKADVTMKDGWYSQMIYRFIRSGILLRMTPIYPNSGKKQN